MEGSHCKGDPRTCHGAWTALPAGFRTETAVSPDFRVCATVRTLNGHHDFSFVLDPGITIEDSMTDMIVHHALGELEQSFGEEPSFGHLSAAETVLPALSWNPSLERSGDTT